MSGAPSKTVWVTKTGSTRKSHPVPGYQGFYLPLLEVVPPAQMPRPPTPEDVLVFTSSNGIKHFCALTKKRDWSVYTVGNATRDAARAHGFTDVKSAGKDVEALAKLVAQEVPKTRPIYYASAEQVSGDLSGKLKSAGYKVRRAVIYKTLPARTIPDRAAPYILVYSRKGAEVLRDSGLDITKSHLVSISRSVDRQLGIMPVKSREIAENPSHSDMIKLLP